MTVLRPFYVDSPSTWDEQDDGLDFSADPDQLHDKLPQPFRLVNKILESLLDDTWNKITHQEQTRDNEANRKHLPKLKDAVNISLPYQLHHISSTPDDELLVGCGDGGLLAFSHDDVTRPLYKFNIEKEFLKLQVSCGTDAKSYVVVSLDTTGSISIVGITTAGFIDISQLALEEEEKVLDISLNEDTLSISLADNEDKTSVVFYSLPLQAWSDPLEQISKNRLQGSADDEAGTTFAKCDLVGRIRQPEGVQPCSKNQLSEALLPILNSLNNPTPLGQGLHHMLPAAYFDNRRALLSKLPKYRDVDWEKADESIKIPHVVFVGESKVLVWWTQHHIATLHTVTSGRDVEAVDKNFIFCSNITSADSNNELIGIGLETGMVAVIEISEGLTLQTSLVSKSPVNYTRFIADRLLASCQDGSLAVLSCTVEGSCAMIQHISSETTQYHVTQILPLAVYSNIAVVVLAPKRIVIVDVDSFRAIAAVPFVGTVSVCSTLNKKHLCMISLDTDCVRSKLRQIHPHSALYCTYLVAGDHISHKQVNEMIAYDTSANLEITENGYINTPKPPHNIDLLSESFFNLREMEKAMRHQRLRERWYQFTEELECY